MKILAVDTCLGACSVALRDGETVLAHRFEAMERGHAEALAPMVEEAMQGHDFASLDRLAVTVGPGTFTGQRVGLSFMRGLRLALNKPLIGVTSLEAMAAEASDFLCGETRIAVIHDARRDEAYLSIFDNGVTILPPRVLPFAAAIDAIRAFGRCGVAGTGQEAALEKLGGTAAGFLSTIVEQPSAWFVALLAATMPEPEPDARPPAPLYLRPPDAKLPGGREFVSPFTGAVNDLAVLHAAAFAQPWDAAAIAGLLAGPGVFAFVAHSGFVLARAAGGEAEILTLAVKPSARGRGLGRALMRAAAGHAATLGAESLFLEVGTDNPAALALYTSLGLARVGTRKGYYASHSQTSGDALVLKAALPLAGNLS